MLNNATRGHGRLAKPSDSNTRLDSDRYKFAMCVDELLLFHCSDCWGQRSDCLIHWTSLVGIIMILSLGVGRLYRRTDCRVITDAYDSQEDIWISTMWVVSISCDWDTTRSIIRDEVIHCSSWSSSEPGWCGSTELSLLYVFNFSCRQTHAAGKIYSLLQFVVLIFLQIPSCYSVMLDNCKWLISSKTEFLFIAPKSKLLQHSTLHSILHTPLCSQPRFSFWHFIFIFDDPLDLPAQTMTWTASSVLVPCSRLSLLPVSF